MKTCLFRALILFLPEIYKLFVDFVDDSGKAVDEPPMLKEES